MRLYFPSLPQSGPVTIKGEDFNYLKNVLRAKTGDSVSVFDGKGRLLRGKITEIGRSSLSVELEEELSPATESPIRITLLQGVLKAQKMDLVIQKSVELGVSQIQPVITARSEVRETRKVDRWRKIAQEAARQCGRAVVPDVDGPVSLENFLSGFEGQGIVFWEEGGRGLSELSGELKDVRSLSILIGPEGGLEPGEISLLTGKGFLVSYLGPRILRAETAAMAAITLAQFLFGDLG